MLQLYFAHAWLCYGCSVIHFWLHVNILVATSCSLVALGNIFFVCKGIMFPSLPVSTLSGNIIETWFDNVFWLAVYQMFVIEINRIYIHHINDLLFHSVGLILVPGHGWFYFSHFCRPPWSGWSCHTLCTSFFRPWLLVSAGQMAWATICVDLVYRHFGICLWFFSYHLHLPLVFSFCQNLLFHLDWWLTWIGLFRLPLFLPKLMIAHLLHLNLPWLWWVL